ncbi:mRNA 3'-end-processing protein yth-1 [Ophiocordyceps camponoti-floridani]|uniref:mRNA 3'-end-processing protein n=1 Tax=Ophiocordyceps camponoti-floridani TaxID=2030778 RepID=A0A8H4Q7Y9_9HYPO|nr:mRNA 3'-end-processing protein yth-1 [Ophiocordyceps camponoti-floridani]
MTEASHGKTMTSTTTSPAKSSASATILRHAAPHTYHFRFTPFLRKTHQVGLPPDRPICKAFQTGSCPHGTRCPERHVISGEGGRTTQSGGLNSLVCKHWLRGLCKKGEHCEFLHEYNLRKMPECNFFMRNGYCSNGEECLYLHVDPLTRLPPCPHYDMGFCPLGPLCAKKHVRRKLCPFYLAGFCPDGPDCKQGAHAKWIKDLDKPTAKSDDKKDERDEQYHHHQHNRRHHGRPDHLAPRGDDAAADDRSGRDGPRDRDDGGRFGRHGRGGGKWRSGRDRRFRGRGH